jgi:outer membrane protein assembly factor BamC
MEQYKRKSARGPILAASLSAVVAVLGGCSSLTVTSDKVDYGRVAPQKPLDVPPDLTKLPRDDRYAVPDRPGVATASGVQAARNEANAAAAAASTTVAATAPNARIERDGAQRWLAVDLPPEKAYAVTRDLFTSVGLKIERDDPKLGIIETDWAENRAKIKEDFIRRTIGRVLDSLYSTGEQDKYRARIERTPKNTAEIFISHRGMVEVYTNSQREETRWQPRPSDPELEAEMLQRLLVRFGEPAPAPATATAAAPTAPAAPKPATAVPSDTRLVKGENGAPSRVEINEPFDRAWRRVGLALDRGGFTVEDRDRTKGLYFVRYLDPVYEAKQRQAQGFFSKIFGGEAKIEAQQFRILVAAAGERTQVTVLDKDGKTTAGATGEKIVAQINEQLR